MQKENTQANSKPVSASDSSTINKMFVQADAYINDKHYDSAQFCLDEIHKKIAYKKPSIFTYFLTVRQAEVYYYNDLQQLGMQESQRALRIATELSDSILLADAYNFCGLFYTNTGKLPEAIDAFKKGIALSKHPPYPENYLEVSAPYHLYGNIAEAYFKKGMTDSAIFFGKLSLAQAAGTGKKRGIASAHLNIATAYIEGKNEDSAATHFNAALVLASNNTDDDIALNALSGLARSAAQRNNKTATLSYLDKGFALLEQKDNINTYYVQIFLDEAAAVYRRFGAQEQLTTTIDKMLAVTKESRGNGNKQYQSILMMAMENEKRILNMEVAEARQERSLATTRLYIIGLSLILVAVAFIAYRYYTKQKLRLAEVRHKISQDLHDEIGATLSGIALYSYLIKVQSEQNETDKVKASLNIIEKNATDMVKKLSDIVWAVNPVHDTLEELLHRLEETSKENASAKEIEVVFTTAIVPVKLTMQQRKNIFLIAKEAVNNAIKYSSCKRVSINTSFGHELLTILIADDGKGFDSLNPTPGNGLTNMRNRAQEIKAALVIDSASGKGTLITLSCKIT